MDLVKPSNTKYQAMQQTEHFLKQQSAFARLIAMGNLEIERDAIVTEDEFLSEMDDG